MKNSLKRLSFDLNRRIYRQQILFANLITSGVVTENHEQIFLFIKIVLFLDQSLWFRYSILFCVFKLCLKQTGCLTSLAVCGVERRNYAEIGTSDKSRTVGAAESLLVPGRPWKTLSSVSIH